MFMLCFAIIIIIFLFFHYIESHLRQLIFSRKSDCLGCTVLLCLVRLFDLASFFHLSFQNMYMYIVYIWREA